MSASSLARLVSPCRSPRHSTGKKMSRPQGVAEAFARLCPDVPPELSPDVRLAISNPYISLQDIVITGLEGGYGWFLVESYKPEATGADMEPWAVVSEYPDDPNRHYALDRVSVRIGLIRWIDPMLDQDRKS